MHATAPAPSLERQGTHALFTTALATGLGLLLSIVVARTLGAAGKGVLDVAAASAGLFTLLLGGSLNVALTHVVARRSGHPTGLPFQLALWALATAALAFVLLAVQPTLALQLGLLPVGDTRFWLGFVTATVAFSIWSATLRGILIGRHALIAVNRIDLAVKAAILLAYLALATVHLTTPRSFALVGVAAAAALAFAVFFALPPASRPGLALAPQEREQLPATSSRSFWPALLAAALPMHANNVLHFLNQRADIFFVQAWHGPAAVGRYALAVSLAQILLLVSSAFAQPLLPAVSAARSPGEAVAATAGVCRQFVAIALPGGLLLAAGAWFVPFVFGRDFSGSIPSLLLLLPGIVSYRITVILISYFAGIGRNRVNVAIAFAALLVTVAGNLWLTRRYGAPGAALTSTAAYVFAGALSLGVFVRETGVSPLAVLWPDSADWRGAFARIGRFRL